MKEEMSKSEIYEAKHEAERTAQYLKEDIVNLTEAYETACDEYGEDEPEAEEIYNELDFKKDELKEAEEQIAAYEAETEAIMLANCETKTAEVSEEKVETDEEEYTVKYRVTVTVDGEDYSEHHEVKFNSHAEARNFVRNIMTGSNFEAAIIEPANGFNSYHIYKPEETTESTITKMTAEIEKIVRKLEYNQSIGANVTVIENKKALGKIRKAYNQKLVYTTLALEQADFDNLFEKVVADTKAQIKSEKDNAAKSTDSYKTAEKFLAGNDLNTVDAQAKASFDENGYKFFSYYLQGLKKAIAEQDYKHIAYYGCELKRIYEFVKPETVEIESDSKEIITVEEYAVSVEAQEIATQAEIDVAKENAEKLNPFSKETVEDKAEIEEAIIDEVKSLLAKLNAKKITVRSLADIAAIINPYKVTA